MISWSRNIFLFCLRYCEVRFSLFFFEFLYEEGSIHCVIEVPSVSHFRYPNKFIIPRCPGLQHTCILLSGRTFSVLRSYMRVANILEWDHKIDFVCTKYLISTHFHPKSWFMNTFLPPSFLHHIPSYFPSSEISISKKTFEIQIWMSRPILHPS